MTPEEIDQLIGEKVAAAISAYAATQNSGEGSKTVRGQETAARDENRGKNPAQRQNKKQKVIETSDAGQNVKRGYTGKLPYCGSCDRHHTSHCTMVCNRCKMIGHMTRDCGNPTPVARAIVAKNVMQYPNKRQADDAGRRYKGKLPYCNKCGKHHTGHCTNICNKCKRFGHMAKDCRVTAPIPIAAVPTTCYECGVAGHFKKNCPKKKEPKKTQGKAYIMVPKEEPL